MSKYLFIKIGIYGFVGFVNFFVLVIILWKVLNDVIYLLVLEQFCGVEYKYKKFSQWNFGLFLLVIKF